MKFILSRDLYNKIQQYFGDDKYCSECLKNDHRKLLIAMGDHITALKEKEDPQTNYKLYTEEYMNVFEEILEMADEEFTEYLSGKQIEFDSSYNSHITVGQEVS